MSDWAAGDAEGLSDKLEERGYRGRIVSIQRLRDLQEEIEGGHRQGLFDEEFYREWLAPLTFSPADSLPDARSLIVAAVPQPQLRVTFNWNGEAASFFVPPTYLHGREADARVEGFLAEVLGRQGYRLSRARLPLKLLSVRSGLGAYGRNNICYVPGMGSFHRLAAFYSDFPCREDAWQEPQMMERCANCSACLNKCPSGAISSERFLLHAERCITFHNEKPSDVPFPAWLEPSWHNCLVGCLHCQRICPQNKDFLGWVEEAGEFSEGETALLLEGVPLDQLPAATARKLEQLDLIEYFDTLPRNLGVFLRA